MATQYIKFKRSSIPGKRPSNSQMELGELALNTSDGRIFTKKENVGVGTTITLLNVWTENVGGGAYINDNIGIGTTTPTSKLTVIGDVLVSGILTATNIVGTSLSISGISTIANFLMTPVGTGATVGGIGVTYYGDGSQLTDVVSASGYADNAGIATNLKDGVTGSVPYQLNPGITTFVDNSSAINGQVLLWNGSVPVWGSVNTGSLVGVATYADIAGIATYADNAGIATNVIGGIASVTSLNVSGITTLGTVEISSGIVTAKTGIVTYYGDGSKLSGVSAFSVQQQDIITSPVYPTFASNIGTSSLGIAATELVYIPASGNLGIGTTSPTSKLTVVGDVLISGVLTATRLYSGIYGEFVGGSISGSDIVGTSLSISGISTLGSVKISSGIITSTTGIVTYYGDGSNLTNVVSASGYADRTGIATYADYAGISTNVIGGIASVTSLNVTGITTLGVTSITDLTSQQLTVTGITTLSSIVGTSLSITGISTIANFRIANVGTGATVGGIGVTYYGDGSQLTNVVSTSGYADTAGVSTTSGYATSAGIATYADTAGVSTTSGYSTSAGIATYADTAGVSTTSGYATNAGIATYADTAGVSTTSGYSTSAGIATYADTAGVSTTSGYATNAGIATYADTAGVSTTSNYATSAGIATYADTAGVSTTSNYATNAGVSTTSGYSTSAGIATYADTAGVSTTSGYATNAGIATYADTAGVSTTSGYATNAGVSTTSGYATSAGIATYADTAGVSTTSNYATNAGVSTALQYQRTFEITGDISASPILFDGTGNVSFAATIQPNSVGLGTDTFGDYVKDITGTANQITATAGTGEGSSPTLSIPNQFTAPQDVTVTRDLQVNRNLNVNGNITIGGTSATLFTETLKVSDQDLVLGFRTDGNGNDDSNDTTANHGGIAIASTEGNPLVTLNIAGIETLPATYKKIMWFKAGSFAGLGTDAWLSNYALGVGTTELQAGTVLAAGSVQFSKDDLKIVRNINASGIITATEFKGTLTGYATSAGIATYATNAGIATYATNAGIATYATNAGIATYATNAGIATYADTAGVSTTSNYATNAGIATYADTAGVSTTSNYATSAGIATYADTAGVSTTSGYATNAGVSTTSGYATNSGIATYADTSGISTIATNVIGGIASVTSLSVTGITTLGSVEISSGIVTAKTGIVTYYGDGSYLTGVSALSVQQLDLTASPVYPTFANGVGSTSLGISSTQVAYIPASGNLGIGTTTPTSKLTVVGDVLVSGVLTATRLYSGIYGEFVGGSISGSDIVGTSLSITGISTLGSVKISSGIITSTTGIVTYYGDGRNLTNVVGAFGGIGTAGGTVGTGITFLDFRGSGISSITVSSGIATILINITGGSSTPDISPVMMGMIF
jgi:hypothetical protein